MPYGTPIGVALPVVGFTADAAGEQSVVDFLNAINLVLSAKVTPAGIDVNSDLNFISGATAYAASGLLKTAFTNQASLLSAATHPVSLYTSGTNGDLYFNNAVGNQVQVTTGSTVNVSSAGGITGTGYGTGGVEVNYDSVNVKYRLRSGATADAFADVECDDVRLNDSSGNFVTIASPALAADYTLTVPGAVPASTSLLQMTNAGLVQTTLTPSLTTLTVTSTGSFGGKLSANGDIALPNRIMLLAAADGNADGGTFSSQWVATAAGQTLLCGIPINEGDVLVSVTMDYATDTTDTKTWGIRRRNITADLSQDFGTGWSETFTTDSNNLMTARTLNGTDFTIPASSAAYYFCFFISGASGDRVSGFKLTWSRA